MPPSRKEHIRPDKCSAKSCLTCVRASERSMRVDVVTRLSRSVIANGILERILRVTTASAKKQDKPLIYFFVYWMGTTLLTSNPTIKAQLTRE